MDGFHDLIRNQALLSSACVKQSAPSAAAPTTPEKRYRCTTCAQGFSRAEHLKRHQTRPWEDTGAKPFSCVFCSRDFSRKYVLHPLTSFTIADQPRGIVFKLTTVIANGAAIEMFLTRSRKAVARMRSVSSETGRRRRSQSVPPTKDAISWSTLTPNLVNDKFGPVGDRVSIQALLNGGIDTFTEAFNLPPCDDRQAGIQFRQQNEEPEDEIDQSHLKLEDQSPLTCDYSAMFEVPLGVDDQYLDFWTGPFGLMPSPSYSDLQLEMYDPSMVSSEMQMASTPSTTTQPPPDQAQYVSALAMAIYNKLWCLALDEKARQELTTCLNFLLTGEKIRKFISLYFRNWHLNCPILHKPSFDPVNVPVSLVISVVFIGAMYSKDQTERLAAKKLVDVAELVVFDSEIFSFESEVTRSIQDESTPANPDSAHEWQIFQELQAGYLMVIAQYWGGSRGSKRRAMQSRFGDVINVARSMQLHHARHLPTDRISEIVWLQKETKIRTISVIALLDCAMRIYSNYPCRITLAELDNDLPCKEAIFSSRHPFMQDESIFAPRLTMSQCFALLFDGKAKLPNSTAPSVLSSQADASEAEALLEGADTNCELTIFDLFILIHCKATALVRVMKALMANPILVLYTYVHSCIMTMSLNLPTTNFGPGSKSSLAMGRITHQVKGALEKWRQLWEAIRSQTQDKSLKAEGMYRNAFKFWVLLQFILAKEEAIDVITGMEVNCDDALTKLKVLFESDNEADGRS
ncbi:putative C2H2 finger domain protein (Zms1) [Cladophialophora carrionii]|uniref:Putative C2H2 finger domain protein (Zms1) n=1 Tax=Cladophialophora carrionii TaxID=86049 RepID=A0A1C1CC51_9EURO|nr:putative C2H2 finger domain protein (Zms1) [Cladophialophora carrionii]